MPVNKRMPCQIYNFINEEVWKEFVKTHTTNTFKELRDKARRSQAFNIYPHHMGQKSYAEMNSVRRRKGYIPSISSSSNGSPSSTVDTSLPDRTYAWLLARSIEDEKGNPYLLDEETQKMKESIDEWGKKKAEGKVIPQRLDDVLSRSLGKQDRRAIAFGSGIGIKAVRGTGEQRSSRRGREIGDAEMEELEARVAQRVREETIQEMNSKMDAMVQEKFMIFAKQLGIQVPRDPEKEPKGKEPIRKKTKGKEIASGHETKESNTKLQKHFLVNYGLQNLSKKCNYMKSLMSKVSQGDTIKLIGDTRTFNYEKARDISITHEDVDQLLTRAWLNISILQVFMMIASDWCDENDVNTIGFMCPNLLSKTILYSDADGILLYMTRAMEKQSAKRFILCPYYQKNHWVLLVLCLAKREVYIFDSIRKKRNLAIKFPMSNAFRSYKALNGHSKGINLTWNLGQCPQQVGSRKCGYYVMHVIF